MGIAETSNIDEGLNGESPRASWFANRDETELARLGDLRDGTKARRLISWVGLVALLLLGVGLWQGSLPTTLRTPAGLLVLFGCALPFVLSKLCYMLISHRAEREKALRFELPAALDTALGERASSVWNYEMGRACRSLLRAECFASLWGVTTTLALVAGAAFAIPLSGSAWPAPANGAREVGWAIIGTTTVCFWLGLAQVGVRTANDDATKRMFAEALRGLILCLVVTLLIALLPEALGTGKTLGGSDTTLGSDSKALGMGAAVAIVGVPAFEYVRQKIVLVFKVETTMNLTLTPLSAIAGMSAQDIARLAEEGLESVEALIETPIPRVFLNTRFSLSRVCDWVDRGLLVARLGADTVAKFRSSTGIVRASELKAYVTKGANERARAIGALQRAMHLETGEAAADMVTTLTSDEALRLLDAFAATIIVSPLNKHAVWAGR